ncbi:HAD-IC family P-type ATPase [bacterium]|nr:HAD-IC family P-type ATPase [bacterium]
MTAVDALPAYRQTREQLLQQLETDAEQGLAVDVVERRREISGPNRLAEAAAEPWWKKLLGQFNQLVVWILIAAAIISGLLGDLTDTIAIASIVILNGVLGYLQEARAAQALAALQQMSAPMCKVIRDGKLQSLSAVDLVPGDILEIEAGDHISADCRLLSAFSLSVQEAALTGESVPVHKDAESQVADDAGIGDRDNMLYMGTEAVSGKATAVVTATGMQTELGQIAGLLQRQTIETTPLQRRLEELGRVLIFVCLGLVGIIFLLQLMRGGKLLDTFLVAVSLAVAAVPEGLPAVVTITLALGLQRMVKRNALIRKLPSVETLGSVTVICSDKTGTLTRNEMTVREVYVRGQLLHVSGAGYDSEGQIRPAEEETLSPQVESDLLWALIIGAVCNNAEVSQDAETSEWQVIGDPTEAALIVLARKHGYTAEEHHPGEIEHENPFDSDRKTMSVVVRRPDDKTVLLVKGAPEMILRRCTAERWQGEVRPLTDERRQNIVKVNSELASRALRVLALAYRDQPPEPGSVDQEQELIFAGLVGMIDPPRDEVKSAVNRCRAAGIRPVMITGDHPETALAIARELGIAGAEQRAVTGQTLTSWSEDELTGKVSEIPVYARVSAEHKLRIIDAWRRRGDVVAMTGDGVNDAPAVQAADIGIAMGITGTDVTKEASDMVLTDDNFSSIVNAVEEGRGIFDNIQKFVLYLLACNASEVLFMFLATLFGWPIPLRAIQVLWINLITDGIPALALAVEPTENDVMQRPPRPPKAPVISTANGLQILWHGLLMAGTALLGFYMVYQGDPAHLEEARTTAFCLMAFTQLFYAIGCRSATRTMPELGLFTNPTLFFAIAISAALQAIVVMIPFFQKMLETQSLTLYDWGWIIGLALTPVTLLEVSKLIRAAFRESNDGNSK